MSRKGFDRNSAIPLKKQVEVYLRKLISKKKYQEGELFPDEMSLARDLGVSRQTIRSGISILVFEGLLERRAGVGTRVKKMTSESAIMSWRSLTREMARKGIAVQTFDLQCQIVNPSEIATRSLQMKSAVPLLRLDRLRGWNDMPILHSRSWFHPRLKLTGMEDFSQPLYEVIKKVSGFLPDRAEEGFLAVRAPKELAGKLQVETDSPLLLRRHIVFDRANRPMELAEVHCVSDRFMLTLDLQQGE